MTEGPREFELTTYGNALVNSGVIVFDEMRQGLKQIEFLANPNSGDLRIGCPDVDIAGIIPKSSTDFTASILAYGCK